MVLNVITKEGIRKRVTEINREEILKIDSSRAT